MKHLLFIASIAICAMSSCTKNYYTVGPTADTVSWVYPVLNSGYSTTDSATSIRYKVDGNNIYISGATLVSQDASNVVFVLPAGSRPKYESQAFGSTSAGAIAPLSVNNNGEVLLNTPPLGMKMSINVTVPMN